MNNVYAYIRVSTKEQNTDRQHEALKEYATQITLNIKPYLRIEQVVKILKDHSIKH